MEIIINTDNHIKGTSEFQEKYKQELSNSLKRFDSYITRCEVYFSDENKGKSAPDDKKCAIEVRIKGRNAETVTHFADTIAHAFNGAVDKMRNLLDRVVDTHMKQ